MDERRFISLDGIARRYPAADGAGLHVVFEDLWFTVEKGEFVCLIGHSGCGKTTILNILAGLDSADDGVILLDGQEITGPALDRAVIFQGHALLPWLSVMGNIRFAVTSRWPQWDRARIAANVQIGRAPGRERV